MIVVVASPWDAAANDLATRWQAHTTRILTVEDLTAPGWCVHTDDPQGARAVVAGEVVAVEEIEGVLTRLPAITEQDLPMLVPEDRAYAASEMTAFLTYWLSTLPCPVLNRPSPPSLCGPTWRSEQWTMTAARLGLAVDARRRSVPTFERHLAADAEPRARASEVLVQVTVVGDRCLGTTDDGLARQARLLAHAAGVEMLAVLFTGPESGSRFVDAHRWVDVRDDDVAEAVLHHLTSSELLARAEARVS